MIKAVFRGFACLALIMAVPLCAQDLDVYKDELRKAQGDANFENYSGPHSSINSLNEIRAIGANLAKERLDKNGNVRRNVTIGDSRYALREITGKSFAEPGLLADVFELGRDAGVDHIRNLREILAGYLEAAYHYDIDYANELAAYITVYNVTKRNRLNDLKPIYNKSVISYLSDNKAGLSASYKEWKGKTQIIIPLYCPNGDGKLEVDPVTILDDDVIAALTKEKDVVSPQKAMERKQKVVDEQAELARKAAAERQAQLNLARNAAKKAEDELAALRRAIAAAEEKQLLDTERLKKGKEDLEILRGEFEKANKDVVRNKFGEPIQGNETAKAKEMQLKLQAELLTKLDRSLKSGAANIEELKSQLEEALQNSYRKSQELEKFDTGT